MGRHVGAEAARVRAQILLRPEVAHRGGEVRGVADVAPGDRHLRGRFASVEERDGASAVGELFGSNVGVAFAFDASALKARRVLIHCDDFPVRQNLCYLRLHLSDVVTGH